MKFEKQLSREMKYKALCWLRLKQRCMFIATEVGAWSSDVIGINEKKLMEIEVKTTWQDFKADFQKPKHMVYSGHVNYNGAWVPTHFYFAVPGELLDQVLGYLATPTESNSRGSYGVINADNWEVVKRAKKLHDRAPGTQVKATVALRMGSELIRFHEAYV